MIKNKKNFDLLVENSINSAIDAAVRSMFNKAKFYDQSLTTNLSYNIKDIKENLRREFRKNWKPQDW